MKLSCFSNGIYVINCRTVRLIEQKSLMVCGFMESVQQTGTLDLLERTDVCLFLCGCRKDGTVSLDVGRWREK